MSSVKRLTPNKIANLVMADEAWHDSEYIAASDYDALSAELAALRAEIESAHAAQLHAEKELSQYMAWYAMAEHQHLHEQRRAEKAEAEVARLRAELECGHPASLMVHSAETGTPLYCELCDIRSQRNDAVEMEAHYRERAEKAEAELSRSTELLESCRGQNGSLIEQNKRLRAWGEEASHKQHCPWHFWQDENKCTCGKRAALAQEAEG